MIFINMPKIMLDGPYKELTEEIGKLLQSWCDGTMEVPKEISKETLQDIQNEILILDYSEDGRLTDAILLKEPRFTTLSGLDFEKDISTDFTIKMKGKRLSPETIKHIDDVKKAMVK